MPTKQLFLAITFSILSSLGIAQNSAPIFEWVGANGGYNNISNIAITNDLLGNVYITGKFKGSPDFDPSPIGTSFLTSNGDNDIFIQKLDAQGNLIWVKSIGGTGDDQGLDIVLGDSGMIYLTGQFADTVDFDPSVNVYPLISTAISRSGFVLKLDSLGGLVWADNIHGTIVVQGRSMTIDNLGDIIITGVFNGSVDLDPSIGTLNFTALVSYDVFILKLDLSGNLIWGKRLGGTDGAKSYTIEADVSNNVYITGKYWYTMDFDPGVAVYNLSSNSNTSDGFLLKLTSNGNFSWVKTLTSSGEESITNIVIDNAGDVIVSGDFQSTVDFDFGSSTHNLTSNGSYDVFILKLDTSGAFIWAKSFGNASWDNLSGITTDSMNSIYTTGGFSGTVDFDPNSTLFNLSSNGGGDVYIQKLDSSGNFEYSLSFGGIGNERGVSVNVDSDENIYGIGSFRNTVDFNPDTSTFNLTSIGLLDGYVVKYSQCHATTSSINATVCTSYTSPSGNYTWFTSGTYQDTISNALGCDSIITINLTANSTYDTIFPAVCSVYVAPSGVYSWTTPGTYQDTITNNLGCDSILTINLSINNNDTIFTALSCGAYTSPSGNYTWTTSGVYQDTLTNSFGCDSVISINLTVGANNASTQTITACDDYTWGVNGMTYTSSGTYSGVLTNASGCDSTITLQLTINQSSTGSETVATCDSFTWPVNNQTYTQSGVYTGTLSNQAGCDSVITLNLSISYGSDTLYSVVGCNQYTAPDGVVYTTAGNYTAILPNAVGCDSVITIYLTLTHIDSTVTVNGNKLTAASGSGYNYQWVDCDNGFAVIPGATNSIFNATQTGNYAVEITKNSCMSRSFCHQIIIDGIRSTELTGTSIYPNPTGDELHIDKGQNHTLQVEVTDNTGRKVLITKVSTQITTVDVSHLSAGVYFITLKNETGEVVQKMVKR